MTMVLMKKGTGMRNDPFGVMLKFITEEKDKCIVDSEHPFRYTVRYELLDEQGEPTAEEVIVYRAEKDTTLAQAESRWFFDFSFINTRLISVTREQV